MIDEGESTIGMDGAEKVPLRYRAAAVLAPQQITALVVDKSGFTDHFSACTVAAAPTVSFVAIDCLPAGSG